MSTPDAGLIRVALNAWKARGWVDVDDAALAVAGELARGSDVQQAARRVTGAFLARNRTTRQEVALAISSVGGSVARGGRHACGRVMVLTAIPVEYSAVVDLLADTQSIVSGTGTRYEHGTVEGDGCTWDVAVAQVGPGNLGAAAEVAAAVAELDPDLFLFIGVAGGLKDDAPHGSVVVANRVYYYEQGRAEADEWLARPVAFPTSHRLEQLATAVARGWREAPVVVKPIAAGEALVGAATSEVASIIRSHYNDAAAVDMESAGLYDAAHRAERSALAIRGISDRLDDKAGASDADRQAVAAVNAARFAMALLRAADRSIFERRSNDARA